MSPFAPIDRWLAPPSDAKRVGWLGEHDYAHRGLHGAGRVENSPSAFMAAIERGMGIECDVQRSRDGEAMVFHDWELDRLTAEHGPVKARDAADLTRIALSSSGGDTGDTIPTLSGLLAQIGGKVPLLIEIKSKREVRFAPLCFAVRRALEGYRGPVAVMSFDPRVIRWFALQAPRIVRGLVVTEEGSRTLSGTLRRHLSLWRGKPEFLAYDIRDLPSRFAGAQRRRGLPLLTWTVRSEELAGRARLHANAPIAEGAGVG